MDDINLEIYQGEILGILGPNGAGKTTFLNILSTLLLPDSGSVRIYGKGLTASNYGELRMLFNMSSGHPNFPWCLTVEENLKFYGRLYGLRGKRLKARVSELIDMFGLSHAVQQRFDELSSGTKQKLALAKCLLNGPKIIFLDEPTVGLDPDIAIKIRELILDIHRKSQATILLTTHNMREAELMCRRIAFLKSGRLIKLASPDELKRMEGKNDLEEVFVSLARDKSMVEGSVKQGDFSEMASIKREKTDTRQENNRPLEIVSWLNRCFAFTYRNFLFAIRNFFSFAELVFWPIVSLISIGLMGRFLQLEDKALAFVLTGTITAGILQVTQLDVAYSLLYEVWSKSVKHTFLTPIGTSEYLLGSWVIGIARGSIIFVILGLSAIGLFGFRFPGLVTAFIFFCGVFLSALLLGMLVSFLILIFGQKAEITAWMLSYLFMLICGIYYPIGILPRFFGYVAQMIPLTYFLEYFRRDFGFSPVLDLGLVKGFGLNILYLWAGLFLMKYAFHQARKKGVIVRLSE
ncbi:MAG: ABC transporter ATP-binding protein/permease [Candidatus Omnitrophica bacterium]|nr:ABC transporter ATP-binding protein/permease [Candidatus Omnitrophota bacterium]